MSLLHDRVDVERALDAGYWGQAITQRHRLLDQATAGLARTENVDSAAALRAVQAARASLETFDGSVLAMFVRRWREDVKEWRKRLLELIRTGCLESALDRLNCGTSGRCGWLRRPRGRD